MQLASSQQENSSLSARYDELEAYIEVLAPLLAVLQQACGCDCLCCCVDRRLSLPVHRRSSITRVQDVRNEMRTAQQQYLADKRRAKEHEHACDEQVAAVRAEKVAAQVQFRSRLDQEQPVHRQLSHPVQILDSGGWPPGYGSRARPQGDGPASSTADGLIAHDDPACRQQQRHRRLHARQLKTKSLRLSSRQLRCSSALSVPRLSCLNGCVVVKVLPRTCTFAS